MAKGANHRHITACFRHLVHLNHEAVRGNPGQTLKVEVMAELLSRHYGFFDEVECLANRNHRLEVCYEYIIKQGLPHTKSGKPPSPAKKPKLTKVRRADDFTIPSRSGLSAEQSRWAWVNSDAFLASYEWRKLRYEALATNDGCCELCGQSKADGRVLHVDHIKPRRKHPELALILANLQILCDECNHGKGNWDETDWRR